MHVYSINVYVLGYEFILSATWLTKNLVGPFLKFKFRLDPTCLPIDFSIKFIPFISVGPFKSTMSSFSNLWNFEFLCGLVCNSATLQMHSITDSFGVLQNISKARDITFCFSWKSLSVLQIPWITLIEENVMISSPNSFMYVFVLLGHLCSKYACGTENTQLFFTAHTLLFAS